MRLKDEDRKSIQDIRDIPLYSASGKQIRLSNVAKIGYRSGPRVIERQNQERLIKVEANIYRRSLGDVSKDVQQMLAKQAIPEEIKINLGSDIEEQAKSFRDLIMLFILGGVLVYMVMAAQFESLRDPFVVMFSVPFSFCGVAWGLFFTETSLNVISFLGLVMLSGVVVNNAIVLVDFINILRRRGIPLREAITRSGRSRLRPILMTTITTLLGMLPLAISPGGGLWVSA